MANKIDLHKVFLGLQDQMATALAVNRDIILHPTAKGTATELHWLKMLGDYLPQRYRADNAFVLDCEGNLSDQIDIVVYDRQYSPFLFNEAGAKYVPAESVYAVLEVRQELSAENIAYAGAKAASVRKLHRTSAPIKHAGGKFEPIEPPRILAGFLSLESQWKPPLGDSLLGSLKKLKAEEQLDLGCIVRHGAFEVAYKEDVSVTVSKTDTALMFFFLRLLARLQSAGTVAAMDIEAYGKSL